MLLGRYINGQTYTQAHTFPPVSPKVIFVKTLRIDACTWGREVIRNSNSSDESHVRHYCVIGKTVSVLWLLIKVGTPHKVFLLHLLFPSFLTRMDENYNLLPHGVNFQDAIFPDTQENRRMFSSLFQFSNCSQGQQMATFSSDWEIQEDNRVRTGCALCSNKIIE